MINFRTIASGSAGNCTYAGVAGGHFLVDAGISGKRIVNALFEMNVRKLSGIFITHEHSDHISGVGVLARRFRAPIYATPLTWRFLLRHNTIGSIPEELQNVIEPGQPIAIGDVMVTAFNVSHDASQPVGYTFCARDKYKIAVVTDLGKATDEVRAHLKGAQIILLESNHDIEMLENGRYHYRLKKRVKGSRGHLSNAAAGAMLVEIVGPEASESERPYVFLGHLSEENNRPMLAYDTVLRILDAHEVKVKKLMVAERNIPGEIVKIK